MKYIPKYPTRGFESLDHAREWVNEFVNWYNEIHLHSGIKYVTLGKRHRGEDIEILKKRKDIYAQAKKRTLEHWSGSIKNWERSEVVALNPTNESEILINKV